MDFKVQGPWNTENYLNSRRSRIKQEPLLKQWYFDLGNRLLIVSALRLFFLCFPFLFLLMLHKKLWVGGKSPLPLSTTVSSALIGIIRTSIYLFYKDCFNTFSIKTYNTRIYQTKLVMEIMYFTGKEMVTQEKCLVI